MSFYVSLIHSFDSSGSVELWTNELINFPSADFYMCILSVVDVVFGDIKTIGRTTAKIKAATNKHAIAHWNIDDTDAQQHGNVNHRAFGLKNIILYVTVEIDLFYEIDLLSLLLSSYLSFVSIS